MHALKVTRIGAMLGIILPPELLSQLPLKEGDTVYLENPEGAATLRIADNGFLCADPAMVEQLRAGHEFMRDYHAAFRALAK